MRDTPRSQSAQYLRASMYEVLGIAPTASDEDVHAAYRRVVRRAHPDAGGSQRAFLRVNAAYRVLSDPAARRAHDLWLARLLDAYEEPDASGGSGRPGGRASPGGRGVPGRRRAAPGARPPGDRPPGDRPPSDRPPSDWPPGDRGTAGRPGAPGRPGSYGRTGAFGRPGFVSWHDAPGPVGASEPGTPPLLPGEPDLPGMWNPDPGPQSAPRGPDARARRRYLVSMAICLSLFVLAGAVVRLYSIPVAMGMMLAAMLIPPLAVFAVNTSRRR